MPWLLCSFWLFLADHTVQFSWCGKRWIFFNQKIGKSSWKQGESLEVFENSNGCSGRTKKELLKVETPVRSCSEMRHEDLDGDEQQWLEVSTLVGGLAMSQLLPDLRSCLSFTDPPKPPCPHYVTYPWGRALTEQLVIRFLMNIFS